MTPTIAALTILSKFENDVKNAENQVVTYCHNKIGQVEIIYNKAVPLISQSANYIMPGQKVKVKAGVGIFSSAAAPHITIGGQSFNATQGYAETEMDAGGRARMGLADLAGLPGLRWSGGKPAGLSRAERHAGKRPLSALITEDRR